jgi:hypothetical protein
MLVTMLAEAKAQKLEQALVTELVQ